jgi:hypothetical protein
MKKLLIMLVLVGGLTLESCENKRNYSGGHGSGTTPPGNIENDSPPGMNADTGPGTGTNGTAPTTDTLNQNTGTGTGR